MRPGQYLTRTLVWFDNRGVDGLVNGVRRPVRRTVRPAPPVPDRLRPFLRTQHGLRRRTRGRRPPRGEVVVNIGWLTLTSAPAAGRGPRDDGWCRRPRRRWPSRSPSASRCSTLVLTIVIVVGYQSDDGRAATRRRTPGSRPSARTTRVGLDGIGVVLIVLTALLTPVVLIASWNDAKSGRWSEKSFFAWILGLEALSIGVFAATDVFLFYVLFEATLIPMYFLIGGFGGAAAFLRRGEVPALLAARRPADAGVGGRPVRRVRPRRASRRTCSATCPSSR